jgi:CRP-like cAMP-binding protein
MLRRPSDNQTYGNRLLDALPSNVLDRLRPHLETVALPSNQTIHEPGEVAEHVFFPTSGLISIVATTTDGESVEIGMIGKEGMFSVAAILGDETPSQRAMVQLPGSALRMSARLLWSEADSDAPLRMLLLRYVQVTLMTSAQTAACNRLHHLEQRCARWLLSAHDRAEADTFPMTHEFLAMMLGVRRPGVTIAAQAFQAGGIITYNHGTMTILDRKGLEAASCECYRAIQDEFARLLGR